jgi:hypothetical protein
VPQQQPTAADSKNPNKTDLLPIESEQMAEK